MKFAGKSEVRRFNVGVGEDDELVFVVVVEVLCVVVVVVVVLCVLVLEVLLVVLPVEVDVFVEDVEVEVGLASVAGQCVERIRNSNIRTVFVSFVILNNAVVSGRLV